MTKKNDVRPYRHLIEGWLKVFNEIEAGYPATSEPYAVRAAFMAERAKKLFEDILYHGYLNTKSAMHKED